MLPWFQYTTVYIGPIPLQVWGFFVAFGMVVTMYIINKEAKRRSMNAEILLDVSLKMIISGVVFARLFHVFFYEPSYFLVNPLEIIAIWHGGLSSFGGVFGAALAFFWALKKGKIQKERLPLYGNIIAYAALFGWMIGRIGCVMIHDHLGAPCNCVLAFDSPEGKRLDMAFLEILALLPLAIVFVVLRKKQITHLFVPLLFVYYGCVRFVLDFWRADPSFATGDVRYLGLTPAQYFAMVLVVVGAVYLTRVSGRDRDTSTKT